MRVSLQVISPEPFMSSHDSEAAVTRLMRFLSVPGITGQERAIGEEVVKALREAGVPAKSIRFDDANTRIPLPTETGNLIVDLPGRGALGNQDRLLFMAHLDTVPLCAGAKPKRTGRKIVNEADTALGGDNRASCAVLVTLAAELARQKLDHPPLTLVFCVREESGLWGARHIDLAALGPVKMGFNFDGASPSDIVEGAVGGDRWEVVIRGRAAHAGVAPDRGISATMILALALASVRRDGWFGKVVKGDVQGTSNVGPVMGPTGGPAGDATNVVTDYVRVEGESRSQDAKFMKAITAAYKAAFQEAARAVVSSDGKTGSVKFTSFTSYYPFKLGAKAAVVRRAVAAASEIGLQPKVCLARGGLDANWLVRHRIPTVTMGAGQNEVHTVDEWIDLERFDAACRLAVRLATMR
jgi:tripeptide aminopeptidase